MASSTLEYETLYKRIGNLGELGIILTMLGAILTSSGIILQKIAQNNKFTIDNTTQTSQNSVFSSSRSSTYPILRNMSLTFSVPNITIGWNTIYYGIGITYVCLGFMIKLIVNMMLPQSTIALLSTQSILLVHLCNIYFINHDHSYISSNTSTTNIYKSPATTYHNLLEIIPVLLILLGIIIGMCGANIHDGIFSLHDSFHLILRVDSIILTCLVIFIFVAVLILLPFLLSTSFCKNNKSHSNSSSTNNKSSNIDSNSIDKTNNNTISTNSIHNKNDMKNQINNPFHSNYNTTTTTSNSTITTTSTTTTTSATAASRARFLAVVLLSGIASGWLTMLQKTGMETFKYNHLTLLLPPLTSTTASGGSSHSTTSGSSSSSSKSSSSINMDHFVKLQNRLRLLHSAETSSSPSSSSSSLSSSVTMTKSSIQYSHSSQLPSLQSQQRELNQHTSSSSSSSSSLTSSSSVTSSSSSTNPLISLFSLILLTACIFLVAFIKFRFIHIGLSMTGSSSSSNSNSSSNEDAASAITGCRNDGYVFLALYQIASIISNAFCGMCYLQEMNAPIYSTYYSSVLSATSNHYHPPHGDDSNRSRLILYIIGLILICIGILLLAFCESSSNSSNNNSTTATAKATAIIVNPWISSSSSSSYGYNQYVPDLLKMIPISSSSNNSTNNSNSNYVYRSIESNDDDDVKLTTIS